MNKIIVITGNPVDGFKFYGPFADEESANTWGYKHFFEQYWTAELNEN